MMAETFRNVRINIQYIAGGQKVILITSTTSVEGKSFVSANIAVSFALLGKKVVIVGFDIRKLGFNKPFQLSKCAQCISQFFADLEHTDLMDFSRKLQADLFIDDHNVGGLPDWGTIYSMVHDGLTCEDILRNID